MVIQFSLAWLASSLAVCCMHKALLAGRQGKQVGRLVGWLSAACYTTANTTTMQWSSLSLQPVVAAASAPSRTDWVTAIIDLSLHQHSSVHYHSANAFRGSTPIHRASKRLNDLRQHIHIHGKHGINQT